MGCDQSGFGYASATISGDLNSCRFFCRYGGCDTWWQLEGVEVTAVVGATSPTTAHLTVGAVAATGVSTSTGSYRVGPLHAAAKYVFSARKEGYHFRSLVHDGSSFIHQRLGDVNVNVVDKNGAGVDGVLVSLSSDAYRNNSATNANGQVCGLHTVGHCLLPGWHHAWHSVVCVCRCAYQVVAGSLFPGVYFVRPMLKEYSFAPSAADITVDEGGSVSVTFTATRVAYSAFGRVVALNGLPVAGVFVEASAVGVASEQATADKQGYYRIRGLVPGLAYTISAHNVSTFTVSPASHAITVSEQSGVGWMCVVWMPAFATATS